MPRRARLDAPGTLHHVIIRGIEKRRIVDDRKDRENFVSRMGEIASVTNTPIYAWALMPNHAHILLRSGPAGLSKYMGRFLSGYAVSYNLRHDRHGHLFQNRYKSIVCDEDSYFRELLRYIHLNPLRAKLVKDLSELDRYPWSGHSVVIGRINNGWQDRKHVLSWFGEKERQAKTAYRGYIQEGVGQGRVPELVGGGLIRSLGGWSQVLSLRSHGKRVLTDERILGSGDFVEKLLTQADERLKYQFDRDTRRKKMEQVIEDVCEREKISIVELRSGSRRGRIPQIRAQIASRLVGEFAVPLAETARQLGVSTSAISKALRKTSGESFNTFNHVP